MSFDTNVTGRPNPAPVNGDSRTCAQTAAYASRRHLAVASVLGLAVTRSAKGGNKEGSAFGTRSAASTTNGASNGRNAAVRIPTRRNTSSESGTRMLATAKVVRWKVLTSAKVASAPTN